MTDVLSKENLEQQIHSDNIRFELEQLLAKHPEAPVLCLPTDDNDCVKYTELVYGYDIREEGDTYIEKVSNPEYSGDDYLFDSICDEESEKEENSELSDEEIEEKAKKVYEALPWVRAIVIYHYEWRPLR